MMRDRRNRGAAFGVLCATLVAARADAQPNAASSKAHQAHPAAAHAAKADQKAAKAQAKADKAEAKAEAKADKAEAKAQAKGDPAGAEKADAKDEAAGADAKDGGRSRGRGQHVSAMRALREEIKSGKLSKAEIDQRLAALKESAGERRKAHREELGKRYGAALGQAATREELRHHARRMAFLNRALVLAQSEKAGKDKDALIERIEKLIEKENARHEKAMDRFEPKRSAATTEPAAAKLPSAAEEREEEDDSEGGAR